MIQELSVSGSADIPTNTLNNFRRTIQDQMTKLTNQIMHLKVHGFGFLWFLVNFKMSEYVSTQGSLLYLCLEGIHFPT